MKRQWSYLILFLFYGCVCFSKQWILAVGESKILHKIQHKTVLITNGNVIKLRDFENQKLLIGLKTGQSQLQIGDQSIDVVVVSKRKKNYLNEVSKDLASKKGLKLKVRQFCPEIHGRLLRLEDYTDLFKFHPGKKLRNCDSPFFFNAKIDPIIQTPFLNYLKKIFTKTTYRFFINQKQQLIIKKNQTINSKQLEEKLLKMGIYHKVSDTFYSQLQYHLKIIAVGKDLLDKAGIRLPQSAEMSSPNRFERIDNTMLQNILSEGKHFNIIDSYLYPLPGKKAEFHSGGEFPLLIKTETSSDVRWKNYGILFNIKNNQIEQTTVNTHIHFELSNIEETSSGNQIPSIKKQTGSLQFQSLLDRPQLVLSFSMQGEGLETTGYNFLRSLSLFKILFDTEQKRKQQYQILIFITAKLEELI